jgi:hypothetical protein
MNAPQLRSIAEKYSESFSPNWRMLVTQENMIWDPPAGIDERTRIMRDFPPIMN